MAIPALAAIAKKALPLFKGMMGGGKGKGGDSAASGASPPILSGAENISPAIDPFAAELPGGAAGLVRGKVTLKESPEARSEGGTGRQKAPKERVPRERKPRPSGGGDKFKATMKEVKGRVKKGLDAMDTQTISPSKPIFAAKVAPSESRGLTSSFERLSRERRDVANRLAGK